METSAWCELPDSAPTRFTHVMWVQCRPDQIPDPFADQDIWGAAGVAALFIRALRRRPMRPARRTLAGFNTALGGGNWQVLDDAFEARAEASLPFRGQTSVRLDARVNEGPEGSIRERVAAERVTR